MSKLLFSTWTDIASSLGVLICVTWAMTVWKSVYGLHLVEFKVQKVNGVFRDPKTY